MAPGRLAGCRVLVVDDEDSLRGLLRNMFEAEGAQVADAANVPDAISLIVPGALEVVISDVQMPLGGGIALYEGGCRRDPSLARRFLFWSGAPQGSEASDLQARTGRPVMAKTVSLEALVLEVLAASRLDRLFRPRFPY